MIFAKGIGRAGVVLILEAIFGLIPVTAATAGFDGRFKVKRVMIKWDTIYIEADGIENPEGRPYSGRLKQLWQNIYTRR